MKLKKLKNIVDNCAKVRVWTPDDDDDTPTFEGYFMNIPWRLMNCKIAWENGIEANEGPIWFTTEKNQYNVYESIMIIHLID